MLTEELHSLYENPDANLAPLSLTLPVYVARVARRNAAADDQRRREEVFWRKADVPPEEGGMPPCPQLPMVRGSRPGLGSISRISGGLSAPQWQALRRAAMQPSPRARCNPARAGGPRITAARSATCPAATPPALLAPSAPPSPLFRISLCSPCAPASP